MRDTSALVDGNLCPELRGDLDPAGIAYAGPRCDGCEHCAGLDPIKEMLRSTVPYRKCFILGHEDHQMFVCKGCRRQDRGAHWYCPRLTYKSGPHVSLNGEAIPPIEEDYPDEDIV